MITINSFKSRKFKDDIPSNTINKIRGLLNDTGIFTIEENWKNSAKGFHSVTIKIPNTNLQTNGKGTSYEYALASGYAELLERLQNQAQFRLSVDISPEALKYRDFYYAPDEEYVDIDEILASDEDWIVYQIDKLDTYSGKKDLLNHWKMMSDEDSDKDFVTLPYMNINNDKISHIPVKMISKLYMSNGMCAGNSMEEALVQGISEIFERAVNKEIINNRITPPTIPRYEINKYPRLDNMISEIESSGNFKVIIKDCSLDKGYPVTGVILINKDNNSYFVKFGSHPKFEISLERTLTELLQGQDVKNMMGITEFSYMNHIDDADNLMGILVNGSGRYPKEFFETEPSYTFESIQDVGEATNRDMLEYLVNILYKENYEVFIRDVSYLGFPSYHVIVPGFSEVEEVVDTLSLDKYLEFRKVKSLIRKHNNLEFEDIENIIKHLKKYNGNGLVVQFLNLPTSNIFPWYYTSLDLFVGALYYKIRDYNNAYLHFDNYVKKLRYIPINQQYNNMMQNYYKCARDYIGCRIDNKKREEIIEFLSNFYPNNIIAGVIGDIENNDEILKKYGELECWNCNKCRLKNNCSYQEVEKIYRLLKDKYNESNIDQCQLKGLLKKSNINYKRRQ
ncbi:YcaO-like family protein [Clostridium sp. D2Q-14]|uniref:YcaO-like family protein n=1 Tax=Anaeromonas gelatinilytica TaxID=2683194 RepID=UPI00193B6876|nr:YcaO-like family protein [Anaeromonas gelatinilytica]